MIRKRVALFLSEESHRSVEVVTAREIEQRKPELVPGVNFDIDASKVAIFGSFADPHVHLAAPVAQPSVAKSFVQKFTFFQTYQDRLKHSFDRLVISASD